MSDIENDFVARRMQVASILVRSERFQGITTDGEPQSYATAHNILEIEESCRKIIECIASAEETGPDSVEPDQFASDVREALRHIHYHIADDSFLKLIS